LPSVSIDGTPSASRIKVADRSSDFLELPDRTTTRPTVGVYYTFLGSGGFGAMR
jgi:hypothetical protein